MAQVSSGNILRSHIADKTPVGRQVEAAMAKGGIWKAIGQTELNPILTPPSSSCCCCCCCFSSVLLSLELVDDRLVANLVVDELESKGIKVLFLSLYWEFIPPHLLLLLLLLM